MYKYRWIQITISWDAGAWEGQCALYLYIPYESLTYPLQMRATLTNMKHDPYKYERPLQIWTTLTNMNDPYKYEARCSWSARTGLWYKCGVNGICICPSKCMHTYIYVYEWMSIYICIYWDAEAWLGERAVPSYGVYVAVSWHTYPYIIHI